MDTLYLDSSAAVKLYLEEPGTDFVVEMRDLALASGVSLSLSTFGYVEVRAALAAAARAGRLDYDGFGRVAGNLQDDLRYAYDLFSPEWNVFALAAVVPSPERRRTPRTAGMYPLRGYDALHLASAMFLKNRTKEGSGGEVLMLTYDDDLHAAAVSEDLAHRRPDADGLRFSEVSYTD